MNNTNEYVDTKLDEKQDYIDSEVEQLYGFVEEKLLLRSDRTDTGIHRYN